MAIATPSFPKEDPHPQFKPTQYLHKLICPICLDIVQSPVHLLCDHVVCTQCCCKHIRYSSSLHCPCCNRNPLTTEAISTPSPLFLSLLNESVVVCSRKCGNMVMLQDYRYHLYTAKHTT